MIMKTTIPITLLLIIVLAIPYSLVSALWNNYSSSTPLNTISLEIWGKILSGEQIQDLLYTATTKKYTKLGYIDWTPTMLQKKQEYYSKILNVLETWYDSEKVQENRDMKQLYEVLYRVIEVSQQEVEKEYVTSLESPSNDYFAMLLENISEAENFKKEVQKKLDTEREKIDSTDLYEQKKKEYYEYFSKTPHTFQDPNGDGFFSTGFSALDREVILHAKNAVGAEAYKIITDDFEKQILRFDTNYHGLTPSYDIQIRWIDGLKWIQKSIEKMKEWPRLDWDIDIQTGLIYKYKVDLYNLYIWVLLDWGLVIYPQEFIEQLWFYKSYIAPFTTDENNHWKNGHTNWKNAVNVLAYFGYSINLDEDSLDFLELSYDPSENRAKWQIDYIENIWR